MHPAMEGTFAHLPLGKKPPVHDPRTLMLASYVEEALPPAPASFDAAPKVPTWPMFGNDKLGDCLAEGTIIAAPGLRAATRAFYDGPAVEIVTDSGKRLTVTSNHPMMTSRGFVRAHELREGEYLLGSDRPEAVAMRIDDDLKYAPSPVEQVFESYRRIGASVRIERRVGSPVDFHGDARFFKGEVDVVDTNGLLDSRNVAEAREVEGEFGLGLAVESRESFHGGRASLTHLRRVAATAPLRLRSDRTSAALLDRHPGVAEQRDLAPRPETYASGYQPGAKEFAADAELPGEILDSLSGLVTLDRVAQVRHLNLRGHVYDFSTERRWYIANGILAHNCTCAAAGHMVQGWTAATGKEETPTEASVLKLYWETGTQDDGRSELDVLNEWRKAGVGGHRIAAFVSVDPRNLDHVRAAIWLFGGVYTGIYLPLSAQTQHVWDLVGDGKTGQSRPGSWGGHAVPLTAYSPSAFTCVTWGSTLVMTAAFWETYGDECWAIVSHDFLAGGKTIGGFNMKQLKADLAAIKSAA